MLDCDIVLTVYDKPQLTGRCLESLARNWRPSDRLIIVDNGSAEETRKFLSQWQKDHTQIDSKILRLEPNQGFLAAANAGLKSAQKQTVCLLSNDTIATAGWLQRMSELMDKDRSIGIINPMSSTFGLHLQNGQTPDDLAVLAGKEELEFAEGASCVGFCMLIRREVLDKIGYLDPVFSDGYFEDTDLCRRAGKAGFRCGIAKRAYVWHAEHATFKNEERQALFARNRSIFEQRWGKAKRQLFVADPGVEPSGLVKRCLRSARAGNWLWVVVDREQREGFSHLRAHGNIQLIIRTGFARSLYPFLLLLKKRKKPITEIYLQGNIYKRQAALYSLLSRSPVSEVSDEK
jgi:GT2 family glycosyltransferase